MKNANSTWMNGRPFDRDLSGALGREVRIANDANCLAVSEATDGAGAGMRIVFAVILGTGCGGGIALDGRVHEGLNGVAGEWGHNPLPWPASMNIRGRNAIADIAAASKRGFPERGWRVITSARQMCSGRGGNCGAQVWTASLQRLRRWTVIRTDWRVHSRM